MISDNPYRMDVSSPPHYRRLSRVGPAPHSGVDFLPAYSRRNTIAQPIVRREPTEHVYQLTDGRGKAWATLKVYSSAKSSKSLPTFFEKENVNCCFELFAEKGDSIQAITATVTGKIVTGSFSDDSYVFLDQSLVLWSKSPDAPRVPSPTGANNAPKLLGHCVWPFSIPLPRTVNLPVGSGQTQSFHLPETFLERHTRASVSYDLTVVVSRGKLRTDNKIKTPFGFIPSTRPDPPSLLRQLAYQENSPLPGPEVDPEGWKMLHRATVRGLLFKTRRVEAHCTLALARPLSYTRGTVIPCRVTLEAEDIQALDILSTSNAVAVRLRRCIRYHHATSSARPEVAWMESFEDVASAVCWPLPQTSNSPYARAYTRHLEGEIRLPKDLKPSSAIGHFSITYSVVLCPSEAAGFTPFGSEPLLEEPVQIATMHAKGPRSQVYSPPAYDPMSRRDDDFYPISSLRETF